MFHFFILIIGADKRLCRSSLGGRSRKQTGRRRCTDSGGRDMCVGIEQIDKGVYRVFKTIEFFCKFRHLYQTSKRTVVDGDPVRVNDHGGVSDYDLRSFQFIGAEHHRSGTVGDKSHHDKCPDFWKQYQTEVRALICLKVYAKQRRVFIKRCTVNGTGCLIHRVYGADQRNSLAVGLRQLPDYIP